MRKPGSRKLVALTAAFGLALAAPAASVADQGGVPHQGSNGGGLANPKKPCPAKGKGQGPKKPAPNAHGKKCGFA